MAIPVIHTPMVRMLDLFLPSEALSFWPGEASGLSLDGRANNSQSKPGYVAMCDLFSALLSYFVLTALHSVSLKGCSINWGATSSTVRISKHRVLI